MGQRVVVSLLLKDGYVVKTKGFRNPKYVGEPINAVRIFNDLDIHELVINDIGRALRPDMKLLERISKVARFPLTYGGGVRTSDDARRVISGGYEKLQIKLDRSKNKERYISDLCDEFGDVTISLKIEMKRKARHLFGFDVPPGFPKKDVEELVRKWSSRVGEIVVIDRDREGTDQGLGKDLEELANIKSEASLVLGGGIASRSELYDLLARHPAASFVCGNLFTYRTRGAVLLNYPSDEEFGDLCESLY